jgi:hypothetical protein
MSDSIIIQNNKVTPFASTMGRSPIRIPYTSHRNIPNVKTEYIPSERSSVCLFLMVLIAWGRNADVVRVAAISPRMVKGFMEGREITGVIKGLDIPILCENPRQIPLNNHNIYATQYYCPARITIWWE